MAAKVAFKKFSDEEPVNLLNLTGPGLPSDGIKNSKAYMSLEAEYSFSVIQSGNQGKKGSYDDKSS